MRTQPTAVAFYNKNNGLASDTFSDTRNMRPNNLIRAAVLCALAAAAVPGLAQAKVSEQASDTVSEMASDPASAPATYHFEMPPQPLTQALRSYAQTTNQQIIFTENLVQGKTAPALEGELSAGEALGRLLIGTGLTPERSPSGALMIQSKETGSKKIRVSQNESSDNSGNENKSESTEGVKLDEIVVTATKRSERLQDVPISITAVTADDIDRRGLVGAADYLRGMPGANQIEAAPSQSISIRGMEVSHAFQGSTGGQTTGTYFGETPTTGSAGAISSSVDIKLVDIERVEVLRGPQGTTFGSAAIGGVVRTIPVAPKLDILEGKLSTTYSITSDTGSDNYSLQAMGNFPLLGDKLALRAVAYKYQDSGFYRNRAASNAAFQTGLVIPQGAQAFASDDEDVGALGVVGGRIAALWQISDEFKLTVSYLTQKTETDGIPVAMIAPYEQTVLRVAPQHVRRGQHLGVIDTDIELTNAVLEYDLGWADLLGSYSYIDSGTFYSRPITSVGAMQARSLVYDSPNRKQVGELRLATKLEGAWNVLAGVYVGDGIPVPVKGIEAIWFGNLASAPPVYQANGGYGAQYSEAESNEKAVFGEVSWEFLPGLTFTAGSRYSEYEVINGEVTSVGVFGNGVTPMTQVEDSKVTSKAGLSYKPNNDTLVYANYSQGFRMGRPSPNQISAALCDLDHDGLFDGTQIDALTALDPDTVDSYELGSKFALMDGRLRADAAVFRMNWTGIPVLALVPGCTATYVTNAGEARSEGIELQANLQITDTVRLDFGGSWIDAHLTKDFSTQGWSEGDKLPGSPEISANLGLQYDFSIGSHNAFVRTDSIYVGPFHDLIGQEQESGDYVKLDASMRVQIGDLNVDLFAKNLTNEDAYTYHSPFALPGLSQNFGYQLRPRTVGLQLGYNF